MKFTVVRLLSLVMIAAMNTNAQTVVPLYQGKIPNSKPCKLSESEPAPGRIDGIITPVLYVYLPEKQDSAKTAVIICPGGGYARLAINHEGHQVAQELNKKGITAFVLKYRQPKNAECVENTETVALMDAQQAIKLVRDNAGTYKINPEKVGVLGFSAGGHLTATLGTHYSNSLVDNPSNTNLRPSFLVLIYPVISFKDSIAHKGSRENMLGKKPSEEKILLYSNELQVNSQTPPTFLLHAIDDKAVPVENSLAFFTSLRNNKVPAEMHLYQKGGHGFGMNNAAEPGNWMVLLYSWLATNQLINGK